MDFDTENEKWILIESKTGKNKQTKSLTIDAISLDDIGSLVLMNIRLDASIEKEKKSQIN